MDVFVTRDIKNSFAEVWPASPGIRKFKSVDNGPYYGAAWKSTGATIYLTRAKTDVAKELTPVQCRKRFGFFPRKDTAWLIEGKKRTRVDQDMEFSP